MGRVRHSRPRTLSALARLARPARTLMRPSVSPSSSTWRATSARTAIARAAVLGHGRLEPGAELFSRIFGGPAASRARRRARAARSSTRPTPTRCAASGSGRVGAHASSASAPSPARPPSRTPSMPPWPTIAPALDFIAITDPGSSLAELARAQEFRVDRRGAARRRRPLLGAVGVRSGAGGAARRGPGGAAGSRGRPWPRRAGGRRRRIPGCGSGAAIGEAALAGRDKLTILTSPRLAAFGDWAEQLVAESTGKAGTGSCRSSASRLASRSATATIAASCWSRWTRPQPRTWRSWPSWPSWRRRSSGLATR